MAAKKKQAKSRGPVRAKHFKIGELASYTGLSVQMLRLYCDMELLHPVDRSESGTRWFDKAAIAQAKMIRKLNKRGGYSLRDIADIFGDSFPKPKRRKKRSA